MAVLHETLLPWLHNRKLPHEFYRAWDLNQQILLCVSLVTLRYRGHRSAGLSYPKNAVVFIVGRIKPQCVDMVLRLSHWFGNVASIVLLCAVHVNQLSDGNAGGDLLIQAWTAIQHARFKLYLKTFFRWNNAFFFIYLCLVKGKVWHFSAQVQLSVLSDFPTLWRTDSSWVKG